MFISLIQKIMYKTIKDIFAKKGKDFIKKIIHDVLQSGISSRRVCYRVVEGFSLHEEGNGDRPAIDFIIILQGVAGVYSNQCTTMGLIIVPAEKQSDDFCNRLAKCLGFTDFLILISSDDQVEFAGKLLDDLDAESPSNKGRTGLLSLDSLFPVRIPKPFNISSEKRAMLYERVITSTVFQETKEAETIQLEDVGFIQETPKNGIGSDSEGADGQTREQPCEVPVVNPASDGPAVPTAEQKKRSKEKTETIRKKAEENKERRKSMADKIFDKNLSLAESTRAVVSSLSQRDQIVFWLIADTGKDGGVNAKGLVLSTNESTAGVNRSIARLKKHGLIVRNGSKKTGKYFLAGDALLRSRCHDCKNLPQCRGIASKCSSFLSRNTKTKKHKKQ